MSDDNIFNDAPTPTVVDPPNPPVVPDPLKELIGDGKKYASVEKALESIPHAQAHIQRLEAEMKEMRERVAEAKAAEEVYEKLMERMSGGEVATPPPSAGLDEASIASIMERKLAEREAEQIALANVNRVKEALVGKYGEKAQEVYEAKAKELGVGVSFLNDVVRKSPKAAEELFGLKPDKPGAGATSPSGINTTAFASRPPAPPSAKVVDNTTDALVHAWRAAKPQ